MTRKLWQAADGAIDNPGNWSPVGVPGPNDDIVFPGSTLGNSQYLVSGAGTAASVMVTGPVDLVGSLRVDGGVGIGVGAIGARLTIGSGGVLVTPGALDDSAAFGGDIVVNGTLSDGRATIGMANDSDFIAHSVTVSGAGAAWASSGQVIFGAGSNLVVAGGASFSSGGLSLTHFQTSLKLDTASSVLGGITLGGYIQAISASGAGSSTMATIGGTVDLVNQSNVSLLSQSGVVLNVTGQVVDDPSRAAASGPLGIQGTVMLSHAGNTYTGGTDVRDTSPALGNTANINTLILAAANAAGFGPIYLSAKHAALNIEAGASGGPNGSTVVIGGAGADTVSATDGAVLAYGGSGSLTFYNGGAASTVVGSGGALLGFAGAGGGVMFGAAGGGNVLQAGLGAATLVGGGAGDQLYANSGGGSVLIAGAGNETLYGGTTGTNVLFGGGGATAINAGAGADLVIGGGGTQTITGGAAGGTVIFGGSGTGQIALRGGGNYVQFGAGDTTVSGGGGGNQFAVYNGAAGGSDVIAGFDSTRDRIALRGYSGGPTIAGAGGDTVILLADRTRLTLSGVAVGPGNIFD